MKVSLCHLRYRLCRATYVNIVANEFFLVAIKIETVYKLLINLFSKKVSLSNEMRVSAAILLAEEIMINYHMYLVL